MVDFNFPTKNATEWLASGKFFDYNKFQIFYIMEGRGQNLILLHGFPTSSWDYSKIFNGFSRYFNTIAIDFLGFGYSSKPTKHKYTLIEQTDIIESFIEKNALKRVKFVFHDYAVSVGQELLARHLEREDKKFEIDGAVFLNGGLFPHLHKPTTKQKLLATPFLGAILAKFFNENKFKTAFSEVFGLDTKPTEREMSVLWKLATYPNDVKIPHKLLKYIPERRVFGDRWKNALLKTEVPLLFINGGFDPVSGSHLADEIEKLPIKNKKLIRWEKIGHYPQWENANECFKEIYEFLK
ncbi:alpha/beta hydrolase [Leptospira sp. 96542]|nr:alpha/beta hydrolase [Leptospira sp. 96542]